MADSSLILLDDPGVQVSLSLAGQPVEAPGTRRLVDLNGMQYGQVAHEYGLAGSLRVEYSMDDGDSWDTLIEDFGVVDLDETHYSGWRKFPEVFGAQMPLVRVVAVGLAGTITIRYVELFYRSGP